MPTESIADLLGHSQVTMTQRYTAGANPDLRDAFLAAMASIAATTSDDTEQVSRAPRLPRQQRIAEPRYLAAALDDLADLPDWLSPTLQRYFSCVRFALDEGGLVSPDVLRVKSPVQPQSLPRYLTSEQMERLLATVNAAHPTPLAKAWFLTLAHTGIRSGELRNLRLSDLDLSQMRLFVPSDKLSDKRLAYLTPPLADALRGYLTVRPASQSDSL